MPRRMFNRHRFTLSPRLRTSRPPRSMSSPTRPDLPIPATTLTTTGATLTLGAHRLCSVSDIAAADIMEGIAEVITADITMAGITAATMGITSCVLLSRRGPSPSLFGRP